MTLNSTPVPLQILLRLIGDRWRCSLRSIFKWKSSLTTFHNWWQRLLGSITTLYLLVKRSATQLDFKLVFLILWLVHTTDKTRLSCLVSGVNKTVSSADDDFFYSVKTNSAHVLQPYLSDQINMPYRLHTRPHNMAIISKTKFLNNTNFVIRMLYEYSY